MAKKYKCRVEYLESTGTQYIDTGINPSENTSFVLCSTQDGFDYNSGTTRFGSKVSEGNSQLSILTTGSNTFRIDYGTGSTSQTNWTPTTKKIKKFDFDATTYTITITYIDNSTATHTWASSIAEFTSTVPLLIFAYKNGSTVYCASSMKVSLCKIYNNGVLARDFIPVLDNSGRPAMYDQVSGQLFYNQGSGDDFSYGRQIIPVEYLESTGTQYINTGVKGKNNLHYKTKINFTTLSTSGSNGIGGEYLANASAYIGMVRANGHYTYLFNNTAVETTTTIYTNTDYEIDSVMNSGSQVLKVNGETISIGTLSGTFTSTRNIFLYAVCSTNDAADVYGSLKMYYCQIYDNDILVRDFIPCIDENLTPFMFDKVNGTVYLNAGTGQFKVGPNVEKAWGGKKLRRKLALALASLKKKRKYYCELEYLKSTGTQYIDTGFKPNPSTTKIDTIFQVTGGSTQMFGCRTVSASNNPNNCNVCFGTNYIRGDWICTNSNVASISMNTDVHITAENKTITIDNVSTSGSTSKNTEYLDYSFYLFACNTAGTIGFQNTAIVKYFKIWDNGVLIRDMIPVLDWNMTPCMYDRVTEQLFYNQGTGNFTAGREIHPVDYLESTGVEYIDTGIKFDGANTKIELKTYEDSLTRRHSICGDDGNFFYYFRGTGNWAVGYNGTAANIDSYMSVGDNVFVIDKNNVYVNGVLAKTYTASSNVSSYNALIFNRKTSLVDNGAVTMYYCKMWNNSALVRDFIPAIDENGVGFMFDRVSHTCFLNQGTGAFKYSAREVEYLQSDGARAIVAGVTVDDTCGYDVKWMALNSNDTIIMGTKGAGDSRWVLSGSNNPNVNISWNTSSGGVGLGLNKIQTAQMNYFNDRKRILNDTPLTDITQTLSANASTYNVGIFGGYWGASSISLYSTCRIYYAKISKGTELIRDFIPMIKDGSPCLFDKIGGLYYFGTGTGTFTRGKIVEPEYE